MSTVANVITDIRYDLKDSGTTKKFADAQIIQYMNRFQIYLAAIAYHNRIHAFVAKDSVTMTAATETYTLPSDFYAEYLLTFDDKDAALKKISLDEYISRGCGTSTSSGQPSKYMILGTKLYICDPLPDGTSTTLDNYYYQIPAAFSTATNTGTMPLSGILDQFWRQFVVMLLMNIDEYNIGMETKLFSQLEDDILGALIGRGPKFPMIPSEDANYDETGDMSDKYTPYA